MKSLTRVAVCAFGAAVLMPGTLAFATPGDVWSLSGDMQVVSNPGPPIDPGAPGGSTGIWTYYYNSPPGIVFASSTINPATDVNGEVPDAGLGWYWADANHVMMVKFTTDSNPPAPNGTGNDKTNFKAGDVGGHATGGVSWTTNQSGAFLIEWLGYNARNQAIATPGQQGRTTNLRLIGPGDVVLDAKTIVGGGGYDGHANAYTNSMMMSLAAGDALYLVQEGNDWAGMDMKITQVPEPTSALLAGACLTATTLRRRRAWRCE
jgi:hypothetical protein